MQQSGSPAVQQARQPATASWPSGHGRDTKATRRAAWKPKIMFFVRFSTKRFQVPANMGARPSTGPQRNRENPFSKAVWETLIEDVTKLKGHKVKHQQPRNRSNWEHVAGAQVIDPPEVPCPPPQWDPEVARTRPA